MNYNLPSFRVDRTDFLKGQNSYDHLPDGGQLTTANGINAFSKPGLITVVPDLGNAVTGSLPASGIFNFGFAKGAITMNPVCMATNSSQDGYYYTLDDSGAMTLVGSADTSQNYDIGKSDTVFYQGSFYTTSTTDIIKNSVDLATRDTSFWVTTKAKSSLDSFSPHPMVVFGDIMYIASARYLHQLDAATATEAVLDLGADWVITAMAVYNNLIYICAEQYWNYSSTYHGLAKMFTWDGYSASWLDEWNINYRVSAMYVFENVLYMWRYSDMGYWDGSRFKPLRPMSTQTYKHQITECQGSMFFTDNTMVVRYGSPTLTGGKRFFNYWVTNSNQFTGIASWTQNGILISKNGNTNMSNIFVSNINTPGAGSYEAIFNPRFFKRPVKLRAAVIELGQAIASGQSIQINFQNDKSELKTVGTFDNAVTAMAAKQNWSFDILGKAATRNVKPRLTITGGAYVRSVDFFYEAAEDQLNA